MNKQILKRSAGSHPAMPGAYRNQDMLFKFRKLDELCIEEQAFERLAALVPIQPVFGMVQSPFLGSHLCC